MDTRNAYLLDSQSGHFVSSEHRYIAEIVHDYDPRLALVWIPPEQRAHNEEFPFAIIYRYEDGRVEIVRKVREREMNSDLVAWLFQNDIARQGVMSVQNMVESMENAERLVSLKRIEDVKAAERDFAVSVLGGKNYYRHNGKVYR